MCRARPLDRSVASRRVGTALATFSGGGEGNQGATNTGTPAGLYLEQERLHAPIFKYPASRRCWPALLALGGRPREHPHFPSWRRVLCERRSRLYAAQLCTHHAINPGRAVEEAEQREKTVVSPDDGPHDCITFGSTSTGLTLPL